MYEAAERPARSRLRTARRILLRPTSVATVTIVLTAILAAAPYVSLYEHRGPVSPVGWDTPTYIWRTRIVDRFGADILRVASPYAFHSNTANPDRPGFPVAGSMLSSFGITPWLLAFAVPAISAVVCALAAGAFAVRILREPLWAFPVYGLALAWSAQLGVTANGYLDNLLVDGMLVAALTGALAAARVEGHAFRGAAVVTGVLFAGATWVHWLFAMYVLAVLAATAVILLLVSRTRPRVATLPTTPAGRLAIAVGAAAAASVIAFLVAPALPSWFAGKSREGYLANLSNQLPYYRLAVTVPLAGLGAVAVARRGGRVEDVTSRRRALVCFAAWLIPPALGGILTATGASLPIQRLMAFTLPLPILGAAAFTAAIRWAVHVRSVGRLSLDTSVRRVAAPLAAIVIVAVAIVAGWRTVRPTLAHARPGPSASDLERAHTVVHYLGRTARDRPFVVVVDGADAGSDYRAIPALHRLRAAAPAEVSLGIRIYLGDAQALLDGVRTPVGTSAFRRTARLYSSALDDETFRGGVAVAMAPYYPRMHALERAEVGTALTDDVRVVRGPPAAAAAAWRPAVVGGGTVAFDAAVAIVVLWVVGAGWSMALAGAHGTTEVALAPAVGIAVLIGTGLVWSGAGLPLHGPWGALACALAAAAGWAVEVRARRRRQASAARASSTRSTSSTVL
jgi:hypothetical protein